MVQKIAIDQCFRGYCVATVIAAVFTVLAVVGVIGASLTAFGYAWIALAFIGAAIAVAMGAKKEEVLLADNSERRRRQFEAGAFSGAPLTAYVVLLGALAFASIGWVYSGGALVNAAVVGYGWLAVAGYGAILTIGLVVTHSDDVAAALNPADSLDG